MWHCSVEEYPQYLVDCCNYYVYICTESDVARGSYNIQQVQLAFAHAYHVLCNAVGDDTGSCRKNSTAEHFLCTNSILSRIICMPHQHDLSEHHEDFSRQKLTYSERKFSRQKRLTPHKNHKLNITGWFMEFCKCILNCFL